VSRNKAVKEGKSWCKTDGMKRILRIVTPD
jgi:hypothetical protein